jgi:hypothetical protein
MKATSLFFLLAAALLQGQQPQSAAPLAASLPEVRRVYVDELTGAQAAALRGLIIASLDSTKLFILTDNPERADAILKGAADDQVFVDTLDIQEGTSVRENAGKSNSGYARGGTYGSFGVSDSQYHHSKDRKHEAYATVRLCNREGDVLWSTTQESLGAKFRGASADVAAKVARQLMLDMDRARRGGSAAATEARP